MDKKQLLKIIRIILEQENKVVNMRGVKGYGASHPYPVKAYPLPNLGPQEEEPEVQQEKKPVKISNVFKNKKRKN